MYETSKKTYNSGYSLVVTHLTTNPPVRCLNRAEWTGSLTVSRAMDRISPKFPVNGRQKPDCWKRESAIGLWDSLNRYLMMIRLRHADYALDALLRHRRIWKLRYPPAVTLHICFGLDKHTVWQRLWSNTYPWDWAHFLGFVNREAIERVADSNVYSGNCVLALRFSGVHTYSNAGSWKRDLNYRRASHNSQVGVMPDRNEKSLPAPPSPPQLQVHLKLQLQN